MTEYGRDVINFAYSYVRNYHVAQDIAQDVFLRALTKLSTFRGDSSAKTWLLSITANRCKDYLRSWAVRHERLAEAEALPETVGGDAERDALIRLERDQLWAAVHRLPVKYREAMVLYYGRALSTREVADVLGTTEQAVRTRLHRGRVLLKEILEEAGDHGAL
ncbi:MAG: sigma-70 family RNA polymerase sigma factor [Alicyclobacillaceae bacterium]|nr:sigma-70 family RNA polymerase sigma factor [Alicyclobacillaceae bacterium]